MEYLDRHVDKFGQCDHPLDGLALDQGRLGPGMVFRIGQPRRFQPRGHPANGFVVFGMDDHESLVPTRGGKHRQHLGIVQEVRLVGHEELDRAMPGGHQLRQLPLDHLGAWVADDDMEAVVDHRPACAPVVVLHAIGDAMTFKLRRKGNNAGGAAERRGGGGAFKAVGIGGAVVARLLDMAMAINPAGQQQPAGGVDLPRARSEFRAEC